MHSTCGCMLCCVAKEGSRCCREFVEWHASVLAHTTDRGTCPSGRERLQCACLQAAGTSRAAKLAPAPSNSPPAPCTHLPALLQRDKLEAHPLFERVSEEELANDPAAQLLLEGTEEGQKVARNGGKTWRHVYRRIAGPADGGAAAAGSAAAAAAAEGAGQ